MAGADNAATGAVALISNTTGGNNTANEQMQIEALNAGLEKVSAQLEASKPVKQVVLKDR